jgi:hypothetical protein
MTRQIVAMVVLEVEDPLLCPRTDVAVLRAAVVAALPGLSRVMAIMGESEARLMMGAHQMALQASGMTGGDFATATALVRRRTVH